MVTAQALCFDCKNFQVNVVESVAMLATAVSPLFYTVLTGHALHGGLLDFSGSRSTHQG